MGSAAKRPIKDYLIPMYMNGLHGRLLRVPSRRRDKTRQMLVVYDRKADLEGYFKLAECLADYGDVTMPDLPGFGGMASYYRIGVSPSLDNLADYLAAVVKLRYKNRRLTIVGLGFGFVVATRMLQKYPDIAKKVDLVVCVAGFTRRDDLNLTTGQYWRYRLAARFFSWSGSAWLAQMLMRTPLGRRWHHANFRTYARTTLAALKADLTSKQLALPVFHVAPKNHPLLNNPVIEQHLRIVFDRYAVHYVPKMGYDYIRKVRDLQAYVNDALADSGL